MKSSPHAVVIGAGIGGLACAARLCRAGYRVSVYEKESLVGGRAHRLDKDGYIFDTGPTILMMIDVIEQLFGDCGRNINDYLELVQLEPNYRAHFDDGSQLTVSSNLVRMSEELARFEATAPEQFYRLFGDLAAMYRLSRPQFIEKNFDRARDFINLQSAWQLARRRGLLKLYPFISGYFTDPRLRMLFSFQSMYLGVSPYEAPAVYAIVSYMETGLGIWYPKGGMHALPRALAQLVNDLGGEIHVNQPVRQVVSKQQRVTGIELADGQQVAADIVVSNADLTYTYRKLLTSEQRPQMSDSRLNRLRHASSALLFYWGVADLCDGMLHHNVYFSKDFKRNLDEIFHLQTAPSDPAFYVYIPTKTDQKLAPPGKNVCYVLVPVPNLQAKLDWPEAISQIRTHVLSRLQTSSNLHIKNKIETETVFTPQDFQSKFNLSYGSAFGLSHYFFQSGYFRPANYVKGLRNMYLVGASTYPGSGVPMVITSAKLVVERILHDRAGR